MVITINDKNRKLYNDFFVEAYEDAKKASLTADNNYNFEGLFEDGKEAFSSLWEYYHYLPELAKYKPIYYTKLPLDEPMVEINGNSREMSVPAQLTKCASIENDHLAESIMFSIDRFHDSQDLMAAQTWIQWTAMNGEEKIERTVSINNNMKDIDFTENKIRFPWPLDSSVTQYPGVIEFSAVFFLKNDDNVVYRYSTLPSKIKIEPALQKELLNNPLDVGGLFAVAVRSNNYGPGFYVPQVPSFTQNGLDLANESNLDYSVNTENGALTLKAQATVGDTGTLSYSWYHKLPKEESKIYFPCGQGVQLVLPSGTTLSAEEVEFINKTLYDDENIVNTDKLTEEKILPYSFGTVAEAYEIVSSTNNFDKYYIKVRDEFEYVKTSDITSEQLTNDEIYEKITTLKLPEGNVPVTGEYFVTAKNTIVEKYSTTDSSKTTLISPNEVTFSGSQADVDIFLDENNGTTLETNLETNSNENYSAIWETSLDKATFGTVSEDWYSDEDATKLVLNSEASAGWYKANVSATRNRETLEGTSRTWRVLKPVTIPEVIGTSGEKDETQGVYRIEKVTPGSAVQLTVGIKVMNDEEEITQTLEEYYKTKPLESDELIYTWTKMVADEIPEFLSNEPTYIVNNAQPSYNITYVCTVKNKLSNMETEGKSVAFMLVG